MPQHVSPDLDRPGASSRRLFAPTAWSRLRFFVDLIVLYVATLVALLTGRDYGRDATLLALSFPLVALLVLRGHRSATERLKTGLIDVVTTVVGAISLTAMIDLAAGSILGIGHSLDLVLRTWAYCALYLSLSRYALVLVRRRAAAVDAFATSTLIIGAGVIGSHLATRLLGDPGYGMRPVALLDPNPLRSGSTPASETPVPVLAEDRPLAEAIAETGAQHVIFAFSSEPDHMLAPKIRECQALGIEVSLVPRMYEAINERTTLDHLGGLPLLTLHVVDPRGWQFAVKHALDRTGAAVGLLLASPLFVVLAALIRLTSPGPVLYRQRRVGRDGHEFDLLKFRSMRVTPLEAESTPFALASGHAPGGVEGLDRRTWIGRLMRDLSLDELPQLINVIRGDMSLVGPRPERPEYVARFVQEVVGYENRHRVRSGITGWAQVHGLRGQTSIADRVEWDNYYILNWSLRLDLKILALTIAEIVRFRENA